nr:MAG TPA: hypothetical protein [Caudoviricetes sp.]
MKIRLKTLKIDSVVRCWTSVAQAKLPQDRINTKVWHCGTCGRLNTPSNNLKIYTQLQIIRKLYVSIFYIENSYLCATVPQHTARPHKYWLFCVEHTVPHCTTITTLRRLK